jgi:hypothetical protein
VKLFGVIIPRVEHKRSKQFRQESIIEYDQTQHPQKHLQVSEKKLHVVGLSIDQQQDRVRSSIESGRRVYAFICEPDKPSVESFPVPANAQAPCARIVIYPNILMYLNIRNYTKYENLNSDINILNMPSFCFTLRPYIHRSACT